MADRYAAAIEMAEWADSLGCTDIAVSEHHGVPDGYIPSPLMMIAAMAPRTRDVRFTVAALIAPFHDPLRIAEDLCVLDNISRGRTDVVVAGGYVSAEFDMFGVSQKRRPALTTELVGVLRAAFAGAPFDYRGRTVQITPAPFSATGPRIMLGGSSEGAARRAARIADGFLPSVPQIWEFYRDEMLKLGKPDPGALTAGAEAGVTMLTEDPEKGWKQMAPYFFYETNAYGEWRAQANKAGPYHTVGDHAELRRQGGYEVLSPDEMIERLRAMTQPFVRFHPLCGGIPPKLAWESLRLFEREVMPAFA